MIGKGNMTRDKDEPYNLGTFNHFQMKIRCLNWKIQVQQGESMVKCITKNTCQFTCQVNKKQDQNPSQNCYTFNLFSWMINNKIFLMYKFFNSTL